jgi:hypothetical protein
VQIYKRQMLAWQYQHKNLDEFRFQPVLPIVFYSGTRTWNDLEPLTALMAQSEGLEDVLPQFKPLFLNIGQTAGETLEQRADRSGCCCSWCSSGGCGCRCSSRCCNTWCGLWKSG